MTKDRDFKRMIRARAAQSGRSYQSELNAFRAEHAPCEECGKAEPRKWKHDGRWLCVACLRDELDVVLCDRCGGETGLVAIGRHAILKMDSDDYYLKQALMFRCKAGHYVPGPAQWGPGAPESARGEPAETTEQLSKLV